MILAIDTTAAQCAVAVVADERTVRRVELVGRGHDRLLFSLIDAALAEAGAAYADLSRIVCCTGPGSFAGVRVGVAAARGLALGAGLDAVGVSRFEALAAGARVGTPGAVGVVLAGRGGTAFFQAFDVDGAPLGPPRILEDAAPDPGLLDGLASLAGDGRPEWQELPRLLADGLPDPAVLARLGAERTVDAPPAPLYLRPPSADLPREAPPRMLE
ncbi:MAG TPA: tRNA (adenosine(37)-N6)-threonylcarbamoyltransferase complex dimerization subunit type 1 TsaB [Thermohalobaculum sp.]|nr:tRNA (adenosine(37)-N6)-threonylcarbamoyltransferase complex dimerization subunit type 1 TsaB [Thermohalobaculum sp.]